MKKKIGLGLIILIIIGIFIYVNITPKKIDFTPHKTPNSEQEIINNCDNLNLTSSCYCLRDNIKTFFFYNESMIDNVYQTPTFERLKENGGICEDWSEYYSILGKKLGFRTKEEFGYLKDGTPHQWTIIYDDTHSCIVDQLKVECKKI